MASRLAVLKAVPGLLASWESCRFTHFGEPADREQLKPAPRTSSLLQPQKIWTKGQTTVSCSIFWVFSLGVLLTSLSKRIALGKVCRRHSSCCHLTMSYEAYARPQSPQSTAKSKGWCSRSSHCDKATIQKQDWNVEMPWLVGWCFLKISLRVTGSELHITGISKYISVHLFKYCSTNFTINNNKKKINISYQTNIKSHKTLCNFPMVLHPYIVPFLTSVTIAIEQWITSYWINVWLWRIRASLSAICVMTGSIKYALEEAPQLSIYCCSPLWRQHQKTVKLSTNCKLELLTVIWISNITRETFQQTNMYEPPKTKSGNKAASSVRL